MSGSNDLAVLRPVRRDDFDAVFALAKLAGGGMTNLPHDETALRARIDLAVKSFAAGATAPGGEVYLMVLEKGAAVIGVTAVFSTIGLDSGFVNYKVNWTFHASEQLNKRIRRRVLVPTHDFTGAGEVGSLFLSPAARGGGYGKLLTRGRYLFIAQKPEIIADPVCAELRGWHAPDGTQPFWEALGRRFFDMEFEAADVHNSATGNQFIADLMPRYPIYAVFLPDDARACIGKPHDGALPAYNMLLDEGFAYQDYIDIFDGGPVLSAKKADIRTIRESRLARVRVGDPGEAPTMLIAAGAVASFRAASVSVRLSGEDPAEAVIPPVAADALRLSDGDGVRIAPA